MNEFEYIILEKKIDAFKTIKQHEECARELHNKLKYIGSNYGNIIHPEITEDNIETYENIYKALRKTINNYKGKSDLPIFITNAVVTIHKNILSWYHNKGTTYNRLCDVFKYDTQLNLGVLYTPNVKILNNIIKNNSIPFTLKYEFWPSNIYQNAVSGFNISRNFNKCLELEELKRTLPKNIRWTLLEQLLADCYKIITDKNNQNTYIQELPKFIKAMEHLTEVSKTAVKRLQQEYNNG